MPKFSHVLISLALLISGGSLTLAFAPFNFWLLAFICPALLLVFWHNISPKQALYRGAVFGLGFFGTGVSWVYISLHEYGEANPWLAGLLTLLMIVILLSYTAIAGYLLNRYFSRNALSRYLLAFPSLWVLSEWTRGWVFTGFPWLFLGYSQLNTPLAGVAPIASVFGVSWVVAATAGFLALLIIAGCNRKPAIASSNRLASKDQTSYLLASLFIFALWSVSFALTFIHWTKADGLPIQVSLIQGDIPQTLKWEPEQAEKSLATYQDLTAQHWNSSLIVWPEAAITFFQTQATDYLEEVDAISKLHHTAIISGIPMQDNNQYYNGMIALGDGSGSYRKRHLVPFGEYIPLRFLWVWLNDYLQIPMSDYSSGQRYQPLMQAQHIPIAAFICYEIAYPSEVLDALPEGKLLVTLSDDSWFGKSIASPQHLQIAQMRALETGRYLLMSTNDGVTAIVDARGKIQAIAPRYVAAVLTGNVQPMSGATPWVRIGIYPVIIFMGLCLLLLAWRNLKKTSRFDHFLR